MVFAHEKYFFSAFRSLFGGREVEQDLEAEQYYVLHSVNKIRHSEEAESKSSKPLRNCGRKGDTWTSDHLPSIFPSLRTIPFLL